MNERRIAAGEAALSGRITYAVPLWLIMLSAGLLAAGLAFAGHAFLAGHDHTFGTTREVPWGILISSYVFFASMSTGLCIIGSLGQVFGIEAFKPISGRALFLALVTIAGGLMSISLELENPWRVPFMSFLSPHPESNIWWKSTLYSTYLFMLAADLILLNAGRVKAARRFGIAALVVVLAANLNMKADMSLIGARGFWRENYMPIYFFSQSALLGSLAVVFFTWFAHRLTGDPMDEKLKGALTATGRLAMLFLFLGAYYTAWKIYAGLVSGSAEHREALELLLRGAYSDNFWAGEVAMGAVIPFLLIALTRAKNPVALATAGLVGLVGNFAAFYDMVIVGQLVPHFRAYNIVGLPRYYSYSPSLHELMIFVAAIGLVLTAFLVGEEIWHARKVMAPEERAAEEAA